MGIDAQSGEDKRPTEPLPPAQSFDALWTHLASDPQRRAVVAARWCAEHAPQLAEIVEARILAETPDCPQRYLAQARLALARAAAADPTWRPRPTQTSISSLSQTYSPLGSAGQGVRARAEVDSRPPSTPEALYQRLYGVSPQIVEKRSLQTLVAAQEGCLRVDPELGRLAIVLHQAAPLRLWLIGREVVRTSRPAGWVTRQDLRAALERHGIAYTPRHIRRMLQDGEGLYWNCDDERVYLRSLAHVAIALTRQAVAARLGDIPHNRPSQPTHYQPLTTNH